MLDTVAAEDQLIAATWLPVLKALAPEPFGPGSYVPYTLKPRKSYGIKKMDTIYFGNQIANFNHLNLRCSIYMEFKHVMYVAPCSCQIIYFFTLIRIIRIIFHISWSIQISLQVAYMFVFSPHCHKVGIALLVKQCAGQLPQL